MKTFFEDYGLVFVTLIFMVVVFSVATLLKHSDNKQMLECRSHYSVEECKKMMDQ